MTANLSPKDADDRIDSDNKIGLQKTQETDYGTSLTAPANVRNERVQATVPVIIQWKVGNPTALAIGAFSTTLTTLSLSLMGFRGVDITNVFIGNFFFVAGIGMVVSAQWELVLGNSYGYTVLAAFGLFYAGFGAILTPFFGVEASYNGDTASYYNALGFWVLLWAVWNIFFLIGALPLNLVYIAIFFTVQIAFTLVSAYYFALADGSANAEAIKKTAGAFAFASGMFGYYTVGHLMCQEALGFSFPMGDTSRYFHKNRVRLGRKAHDV